MRGDQISLIRQLKSEGKTLVEIAAQVGLEIGDVQTAVNIVDFMAEQTEGGGASPFQLVKFPFAHDTPGLTDGVVVYTPKVGDLLLDAWVQQDEVWNGTSPKADLGTFVSQPDGGPFQQAAWGIYKYWAADSIDLTADFRDNEWGGAGLAAPAGQGAPPLSALGGAWNASQALQMPAVPSVPQLQQALAYGDLFVTSGADGSRVVPMRFTATHPLKIVVSQSGLAGGADPGATQGAATLCVHVHSAA